MVYMEAAHTNTTWTPELFDAETGDLIGHATVDQVSATIDDAGDTGIILIDADGDVVTPGGWAAQQPGVRRVYVSGDPEALIDWWTAQTELANDADGEAWALRVAGVDRDELPELADIITTAWRRRGVDAIAELLERPERPIDGAYARHATETLFGAWWTENGEDLVERHAWDHHTIRAAQAAPYEVFREVLDNVRSLRNVTHVCSGYDFELFRDGFVPDLGEVATVDELDDLLEQAANACIDAWCATRHAQRVVQ